MTKSSTPPETRSENLFATDADDSGADGRFEVAEEVSLDQQTDSSRRVGQIADDDVAGALAPAADDNTGTGIKN